MHPRAKQSNVAVLDNGDPVFRSLAPQQAQTHQSGQAFHSLGFAAESKVVNKYWAAKCESSCVFFTSPANKVQVLKSEISCRKILTETAMQLIRNGHLAGRYKDRVKKLEPPYMSPSVDPEEYSKVYVSTPLLIMMWLTL